MTILDFNINSNNFNPGYAIEQENRKLITEMSTKAAMLMMGDLPERMDIRQTELFKNQSWLQVEDQEQIGSCWQADSMITMADGTRKPIQEVVVNDLVISHTGKARKVNKLFRRNYTGKLYTIHLEGHSDPVTVTDNHKYLLESQDKSREIVDNKFVKIRADELKTGDVLYLFTKSSAYEKSFIDLAEYLPEDAIVTMEYIKAGKRSKKIPRYIELNSDLGWLLGFYAAEGYVYSPKKHSSLVINFATNAKEKEYHQKIHRLMAEIFGLELRVKPDPRHNNHYQYTNNRTLGLVLLNMFGKGAANKVVPKEIFSASKECKLNFIKGWIAGDGSEKFIKSGTILKNGKTQKRNSIQSIGYTISNELGCGIQSIALSIGLNSVLATQKAREGNRKQQKIIRFNQEDTLKVCNCSIPEWALGIVSDNSKQFGAVKTMLKNKERVKITDSLTSCKIKSITIKEVSNFPVYNLEADVEHTVVVNGIAGPQCQGQSLTECAEFCYGVQSGRVIQMSRMYAYLRSQMFDNIKSDQGSTLSGGTKCALEGICLESIAPYPSRYPGWGFITEAMKQDAKNFILKSHTEIKKEEDVKRYIGSGLGIVHIGISWGNSMNPNSQGIISSFTAGQGGHAVNFCGYVPDSDVGVKSSKGYFYLLKNSWSTRWGLRGFAYVDPRAISQMLSHQWSVFIGRSDMTAPEPRPVSIDFTKKENSING